MGSWVQRPERPGPVVVGSDFRGPEEGHCCHPEIHPAEQIWWSDPFGEGRVYFCNLFCDESGRFWWRDQMDDGTKLKPWAEPPI